MVRILLKLINIFRNENLALFTVTTFTASEKVQKTETVKQGGTQDE